MENKSAIYSKISSVVGQSRIVLYPNMSKYCTFGAGGKAEMLVSPKTPEELGYVLAVLNGYGSNFAVMGNGSNILVRDEGYDGVIVRIGDALSGISCDGQSGFIFCEAGALLSAVAKTAQKEGLSGLEFASGIPGSVGGAVFMNAGAYDGEIANVLEEAIVFKKDGSGVARMKADELEFSYRHSRLMESGDIVIQALFRLKKGEPSAIAEKMKEFAARRSEKQPLSYPSAGSFFKRPAGYFAGTLIEQAGLKGISVGGAQVSSLHSGFIINTGSADATDIVELMTLVQNVVYDKFGVKLEPEVRIL